MPENLHFRLRLERGAAFTLDMTEVVPLRGITAIVGPSGSGKTTLLRTLAGLDRRAGDDIRIVARNETWDDASHSLPPEERNIGFVFQEPNLFPHLSVEQNLRYGARRRDVKSIDGIVEALDLAPLLPRGTGGLSGGEARRVALGRALAANPSVLFLDEPLSGLDTDRKADVLPYLARAVSEARVPALYVTHAMDEVTTLADRVLSIARGRIIGWSPTPIALFARVVGHSETSTLLQVEGAPEGEGRLEATMRARIGERVRVGIPRESIMVSATHPGDSSALASFPALVRRNEGEVRGLDLSVFGQELALSPPSNTSEGEQVWVSILRALPRPEPIDSTI